MSDAQPATSEPSAPRRARPVTAGSLLRLLVPGAERRTASLMLTGLLTLIAVWSSPLLPGALHWGDAALGLGRADIAAAQYDRVAEWTPLRSLQHRALERSALVYGVELDQPVAARMRLEWIARLSEGRALADVKERIAGLLLEEGQPVEAARLLREAHDADPGSAAASQRLARSAELLADHGAVDAALTALQQVAEQYPGQRARANIGRGQLLLAQGDALEALALFEDAVDRTFNADLRGVAKLGAATCLERLGNLDGALAELDEADLPHQVRASRLDGLRARRP